MPQIFHVCASVRSFVRPSRSFPDLFWTGKTHILKGFGSKRAPFLGTKLVIQKWQDCDLEDLEDLGDLGSPKLTKRGAEDETSVERVVVF